ncbi:MAG: molecular chaperone HtpG, partial [Pseudomonadota bacterium]|nr:molecular chaperone HtpG [Pseudomonadota bacterium]
EVTSRKAGSDAANVWCSQGDGAFTVEKCEQGPARGTKIQLFLRDDAEEFLDEARLTSIVKAYSDHIAIPVIVGSSEDSANSASALWTRPKSEISEDQYREFYHHCAHSFDEPWLTMHWKGEGVIDYTALLFIPTLKPFDLYDPRRLTRLRLYVRRIFITDNAENLLPAWLRFLRGVIDSIDLPLSVSREMLQHNPVMTKIRTRVTKKVLGELGKLAKNDPDRYAGFWEAFGAVVKEGLYEDAGLRADIFKIARFRSTKADGWTSLADYVGRMKDGQKAIYFVSGEDEALLKASPQLEGFAARDIEVLLLTDSIDEFWMPVVESFEDKPFKSITRAGADLAAFAEKDKPSVVARDEDADNASALIGLIKTVLGPAIKDVRVSHVLVDSPVCLSVDTGDVDFHMERMLKQHKQLDLSIPRILEVNPAHHLIRELNGRVEKEGQNASLENIAWLLLDQARILEGEPLPDPAAFGRRLTHVLEGAVKKDHQDTKYAKKH